MAISVPSAVLARDVPDTRHGSLPLLETVLLLDREYFGAEASKQAWDTARERVPELDRCFSATGDLEPRADCYLAVLFGDKGIRPTRRSPEPRQSSAAAALTEGHGTCAALIVVALAMTEDLGAPFEAVVLRDHVLLELADSPDTLYEVLEKGRVVSEQELGRYKQPPGGPIRVSGHDYLPYYLDNLAARFAESGDDEKAEQAFEKALELGPKVARVHYNQGTFLLERGRHQEALEHLSKSIDLGWKDADAFVNRGAALWKVGRRKAAERSFRKALKLDPGNHRARTNLRKLESGAGSQ